MHLRARVATTTSAVATALALSVSLAPSASAEPPGIPSTETAESQLAALPVEAEGPMTGYDRDEFPHWSSVEGNCNTRETVLARDGEGVESGTDCYPTSGDWYSEYDGESFTVAGDLDIDHVVPLAEAWRSGADNWSEEDREAFANDLEGPQLIAVSASSNRSKGDQDPSTWWPEESSYRCTYAKMWVSTKYRWGLALQSEEKTALTEELESC
ncbi:MAG TPA: HNH endonuclease family protein [Candidatus Janibacter merdipullorum]|nr:HNH endonuclease family protein [Candidatus Janibacter merdipullorum]